MRVSETTTAPPDRPTPIVIDAPEHLGQARTADLLGPIDDHHHIHGGPPTPAMPRARPGGPSSGLCRRWRHGRLSERRCSVGWNGGMRPARTRGTDVEMAVDHEPLACRPTPPAPQILADDDGPPWRGHDPRRGCSPGEVGVRPSRPPSRRPAVGGLATHRGDPQPLLQFSHGAGQRACGRRLGRRRVRGPRNYRRGVIDGRRAGRPPR